VQGIKRLSLKIPKSGEVQFSFFHTTEKSGQNEAWARVLTAWAGGLSQGIAGIEEEHPAGKSAKTKPRIPAC